MTLEQHLQLMTKLTEIQTKQTSTDDTIDEIKHRLFGNGQPGVLKEHEDKIDRLMEAKWWGTGVLAVMVFALGSKEVLQALGVIK